jgi:hypothetical protein
MPASKLSTFATKAMNGGATPPAKARTFDRIEWVDYGTDSSSTAAAEVASDEIDMIYETISDSVDVIDGLG